MSPKQAQAKIERLKGRIEASKAKRTTMAADEHEWKKEIADLRIQIKTAKATAKAGKPRRQTAAAASHDEQE